MIPKDKRPNNFVPVQRFLVDSDQFRAMDAFLEDLRTSMPDHIVGYHLFQEMPDPLLESIAGHVENKRRVADMHPILRRGVVPTSAPTEH
jgi:hypothetical protein